LSKTIILFMPFWHPEVSKYAVNSTRVFRRANRDLLDCNSGITF
jgi:hypothetical protein